MATLAERGPLQTKLVQQVAKQRGFEPDRKPVGEVMAAAQRCRSPPLRLGDVAQAYYGARRTLDMPLRV